MPDQHSPSPDKRELHAIDGFRDAKGRFLPGTNAGGRGAIPTAVLKKKEALHQAISPEMIQTAILDVYQAALDAPTRDKRGLWQLFLEHTVGKPTQGLELTKVHETNVNIDLTSLSNDELEAWDDLMRKARPVVEVKALPND